jgi:hypothetical protein
MISNLPAQTAQVAYLHQTKPDSEIVVSEGGKDKSPLGFQSSLAAHVNRCWDRARTEKQAGAQERLLRCERQRRGEYDPEKKAEIAEVGGSEVFVMVTDVKCRAASAWIMDVFNAAGGDVFDLVPAQEPDIPPEVRQAIVDTVRMEANQAAMMGGVVTPEAVRERMEEIHEKFMEELREESLERAERMAGKIRDQLDSGDWSRVFIEFVSDFVCFPTAILKAPMVKRQKRMMWGANYEAVAVSDLALGYERVSPYDAYPSPGSTGPQDGYFIQHHRLGHNALYDMIGVYGYDEVAIREVLAAYPSGFKNWLSGDWERAKMEGKSSFWEADTLDVLEYWGGVSGAALREWGMPGKLDPERVYECNVWWVGPWIIKAVLNPHPLGKRPYRTASWEPIPGAFWGKALPEIMRDMQAMINASARSLSNNMGLSSGPQVEVHTDRLPAGEKITSIFPWKIWQTTSDRSGGNNPAVRFFQPPSNANELMAVMQAFIKQCDEVTGIPNYVYGSTSVGGAGRTASGLNMLMDNAAKGIKQAVSTLDVVVGDVVDDIYHFNMSYSPDPYCKGDFKTRAKGASGLILREQIALRRKEFLQATANPIDAPIMGAEGRSYLLREVARSLQMETDEIVPTKEKMAQRQLEQQMLAQGQNAVPNMAAQTPSLPSPGGGGTIPATDTSVPQAQPGM